MLEASSGLGCVSGSWPDANAASSRKIMLVRTRVPRLTLLRQKTKPAATKQKFGSNRVLRPYSIPRTVTLERADRIALFRRKYLAVNPIRSAAIRQGPKPETKGRARVSPPVAGGAALAGQCVGRAIANGYSAAPGARTPTP
jgi:hypothetical protein